MFLVFKGNSHRLACVPPNRIEGERTIAVVYSTSTKQPILITANFVTHSSTIGNNSINLLAVAGQSPVYVSMKPGLDAHYLYLLKSDLSPFVGKEMVVVCHVAENQ